MSHHGFILIVRMMEGRSVKVLSRRKQWLLGVAVAFSGVLWKIQSQGGRAYLAREFETVRDWSEDIWQWRTVALWN